MSGWRKLEESPPFLCNGMQLRSYQLDGLNWMRCGSDPDPYSHPNPQPNSIYGSRPQLRCPLGRLSYYLGRNVILGDEMGLGKTAQSVSMLQSLRSMEGVEGPFLIVAPLSTLPHWERELSLWTVRA